MTAETAKPEATKEQPPQATQAKNPKRKSKPTV